MFDELRPIPGYEGLYSVTRDGRVWSHARTYRRSLRWRDGRWLTPSLERAGYLLVKLTNGDRGLTQKVHRLVASAWIPNPDNLPWINHKNGVKIDNRDTNLEWCTASHNAQHAFDTGLRTITPRTRKHAQQMGMSCRILNADEVQALRARRKDGESMQSLADAFGLGNRSTVWHIVHEKTYRELSLEESHNV